MGRTACTEPQCLYKSARYLFFYVFWDVLHALEFEQHLYIVPGGPFPLAVDKGQAITTRIQSQLLAWQNFGHRSISNDAEEPLNHKKNWLIGPL
jgi:hypothetical protein